MRRLGNRTLTDRELLLVNENAYNDAVNVVVPDTVNQSHGENDGGNCSAEYGHGQEQIHPWRAKQFNKKAGAFIPSDVFRSHLSRKPQL